MKAVKIGIEKPPTPSPLLIRKMGEPLVRASKRASHANIQVWPARVAAAAIAIAASANLIGRGGDTEPPAAEKLGAEGTRGPHRERCDSSLDAGIVFVDWSSKREYPPTQAVVSSNSAHHVPHFLFWRQNLAGFRGFKFSPTDTNLRPLSLHAGSAPRLSFKRREFS